MSLGDKAAAYEALAHLLMRAQAVAKMLEAAGEDLPEPLLRLINKDAAAKHVKGLIQKLAEAENVIREQHEFEERIWRNCRVIYAPKDDPLAYPLEHNPHAGKDMRLEIFGKLSQLEPKTTAMTKEQFAAFVMDIVKDVPGADSHAQG